MFRVADWLIVTDRDHVVSGHVPGNAAVIRNNQRVTVPGHERDELMFPPTDALKVSPCYPVGGEGATKLSQILPER